MISSAEECILCLAIAACRSVVTDASPYTAVRNPLHANATVKVTNVTRFSYAEYSDKSVALYARGEAGWFILGKPARPYSGIYQDMIEAVEVMYFLVDYHRQTSKDIFEEVRSLTLA